MFASFISILMSLYCLSRSKEKALEFEGVYMWKRRLQYNNMPTISDYS